MSDDDLCMHEQPPALCSICNGREAAARRPVRKAAAPVVPKEKRVAAARTPRASSGTTRPSTRVTTTHTATQSADTEESVEQYRAAYGGDRAATFDAYVAVFFGTEARTFPGGFVAFTRCANGDPERRDSAPALVARAERLMKDAGYEPDGGAVGSRRWRLSD